MADEPVDLQRERERREMLLRREASRSSGRKLNDWVTSAMMRAAEQDPIEDVSDD